MLNSFPSGPAVTAGRPRRTVPYVAAPPTGADPGAEPAVTAGVASLAVRDLLRGIRRHGKVLAALPHAIYLEFADTVPEPRVIAVSPPDAIRLPNAIITGPWDAPPRVPATGSGECWAGGSRVLACGLDVRMVPDSSRRAARPATWPAPWRRPSTSWASVPGWCRAATAWSAGCCWHCDCWAGPSPAGPGRYGSRTGS